MKKKVKYTIMNIDMKEVQNSFDRTDKIIAFKKELTVLINQHSIDSLFDLPDSVLAAVAVGQMQIVSSITSGLKEGKYPAILIC